MTPPFDKIASSNIVTFLVGNEERQFSMHADVITGLSRALNVLVNGSCDGARKLEEARTGIITWRDIDEDTFIRFFQFAYTGDYSSATPTTDVVDVIGTTSEVHQIGAAATEPAPEATIDNAVDDPQDALPAEDEWGSFSTRKPKKSKKKISSEKQLLWRKFLLLDYDEEEVEAIENSTSLTHNHADICLSHARVYVMADFYGIDRLMSLSLRKMHRTLASMIPNTERTPGFAELVRYSFRNTVDKCGNTDQLRHMLCLYAACRLEELWASQEFQDLFKAEGEFSCEVIKNVLVRLK